MAVDRFQGNPELVPIHHSTIELNNHTGANVAGGLAVGMFYKPKLTVELAGLHARVALHDSRPSFYLRIATDTDNDGDSPNSDSAVWALVRANATKDHRVLARIQFTSLTGHAKRADGLVDTETETLPGGWVKITPKEPLTPGEYAVTPVFKTPNTFSTVVYDFTFDPDAPNTKDAILATP